tara:strand:+ start:789 stop:1559 length:771 start_codon:yes stop_codon:yes gene_type:complete
MKTFEKPLGLTPNDFKYLLIKENKLSEKSCCFARLDPLARGLEPYLEDEEVKLFDNYLYNSDKEYEAEIILGISTDTDDIMGIYDDYYNLIISEDERYNIISKITDEFDYLKKFGQSKQKYHPYSSFMLRKNGEKKPLWKWKKLNKLNDSDIPTKNINLYDINIIEYKTYNYSDLLQEFVKRINLVDKKHEFRQNNIIDQWLRLDKLKMVNEIYSIKFRINVSSGYYVRQFCYDLKKKINFPLVIFDINRTNINFK